MRGSKTSQKGGGGVLRHALHRNTQGSRNKRSRLRVLNVRYSLQHVTHTSVKGCSTGNAHAMMLLMK